MVKEYLYTIGTAVLAYVAYYVRVWVAAHVKPRQLQTVLDIARTVVGAADKIGQDFGVDNKAKYDFAKKTLQSVARKVGVHLKDDEAMAFIHAVLKEIRDLESYEPFPVTDEVAPAGN